MLSSRSVTVTVIKDKLKRIMLTLKLLFLMLLLGQIIDEMNS